MKCTVLIFVVVVFAVQMCQSYPIERECTSAADCGPDECCVIGMVRYSIPKCRRLGQVEDYCRSYNEPENKTLAYPNGQILEVADVFTLFCPCEVGHVCHDARCHKDQATFTNILA